MIAAPPLLAPLLALALAGSPPLARTAAPLRPADWLQSVQDDVARSEYSWSATGDGAWSAPNRAQGLRSRIVREGIEVFPRATDASGDGASWRLTLRTVGFGVEGAVRPIGETTLTRDGNRIEQRSAALAEWYVNDERGIEQGWTIHAAPPGPTGRPLRIELAVDGLHPRIDANGLAARFVDGAGELRLRYTGLAAWDTAGSALPVRLVRTRVGLAVEVRVEGARYPITVDPVIGGPFWTAEGDQEDAEYGFSVAGAGDVNGDGFDDFLVGARFFDHKQANEGRAFLYLGSPLGPSNTPAWTAENDQASSLFGSSVAGAGDVNGDGYDDVLVGAPYFDDGESDEGRAYLYLGSAAGPSPTPDWTAESDDVLALFGTSVAGAGDVNGDGYDDVLVGSPLFEVGPYNEGRAWLYLGSAGGPSLAPDWTAEGGQAAAKLGESVSGAGDVNGDGYDDIVVGVPGLSHPEVAEGGAFLYLGSPAGPSPAPDWTGESDQTSAYFGTSVSGAGDVDGDGFDDVIVGAYAFDAGEADEGRAFLYRGSAAGPSLVADWTAEIDQPSAYFGRSVAGAGDVNGDGFDDVLVGAEGYDGGQTREGGAFLYLGSAGGPSLAPDWVAESDTFDAYLGRSVAGAGDVNGDGYADVIVGAFRFEGGLAAEGKAYLYFGDDGAPIGTSYCGPAVPNSSGLPGVVQAYGSDLVAENHVLLVATQLPAHQYGYFLTSQTQGFVANPGGSQGNLCLGGTIGRYAKAVAASGAGGVLQLGVFLDEMPTKGQTQVNPGETWSFQAWFRDWNPIPTSNFTDGVAVLFQ